MDTSPDSKCSLCLDRFDSAVYLDPCWHKFCFHCIQEWSKFKAECPLCQQPFFSLHHTDHTEDDRCTSSANESTSNFDHTTVLAESTLDLEAWDQHANFDCPTTSHNKASISGPIILPDYLDQESSMELDYGPFERGVVQVPWDDKASGSLYSRSEEYGETLTCFSEFLDSSDEDTALKVTALQPQLQAGFDSSDSDSRSQYRDITRYTDCCVKRIGCLNLYANWTSELFELSTDSEDSIREEKREDVKKEQSVQDHSWGDKEPNRAPPCSSPLHRENVSTCQSTSLSVVKRTVSMDDHKNKDKIKDPSPYDSGCILSSGMDVCSPRSQKLSRKRKTSSSEDCDDSHGHWPWRKCHSEHQFKKRLSKSSYGSKYWSKRSRESRPHDTSSSLKSQTDSKRCKSTTSRDSSRSQSHHKSHGQMRSSSLDSDCYRKAYCLSSYLLHSPKIVGVSASCSTSIQPEAHCSRKSPGLESRIESSTERTDLLSQMGLQEDQDFSHEQCRSRSQSSYVSRSTSGETDGTRIEKPGGKRKCKTRHLENTEKRITSMERGNSFEWYPNMQRLFQK